MINLLLVEDSPTIRDMFIYTLASENDIKVVGVAENGEEALKLCKEVKPDIILMDIDMPKLNGYETAKIIMQTDPRPIILMTATWDIDEVRQTVKDQNIAVLAVCEKPYGPGHPQFKKLYNKIVADIRLMSDVKVIRHWNSSFLKKSSTKKKTDTQNRSIVLIGASTGGPPILEMILKALPADYPLPVLVVQHINSEFIDTLIQWLDDQCSLKVKKAEDDEKIQGGYVYIAPSKYDLTLEKKRIKLLRARREDSLPSISRLFSSVSPYDANEVVAILLSGMGSDGAKSITELKQNGALTLAQNEATSVVFGIANEAIRQGGIELILPPEEIIEQMLKLRDQKEENYHGSEHG